MAKANSSKPNAESSQPEQSLSETVYIPDAQEAAATPHPSLDELLTEQSSKAAPWPKRLWHWLTASKKRVALLVVGILVALFAVVWFTPVKYSLLGWAFPGNVTVRVTDNGSHQLLPGASVTIAGVTGITDKTGTAHLTNLKPGKAMLKVAKPAYKDYVADMVVEFGDNVTRDVRLSSTGIVVSFKLTNFVTDKPVGNARVQLADADVVASANGVVEASVSPSSDGQALTATVSGDDYNDQQVLVKITPGADPVTVKMVPKGQIYFLSNRSGKIDLYQANLDGSEAQVVLAGTGNEDQSTGILPNVYDQSVLAFVSSRAGHRSAGQLQEDLYLFRPATKELTLIDTGIDFGNFRAWLGKTLVYQKYTNGTGTTRSTIQAYDTTTKKGATISACTSDGACPTALYATDDLFIYTLNGAPVDSTSNGLFVVKSGSTKSDTVSANPGGSPVRQVIGTLLLQYYNNTSSGGNLTWQTLDLATSKVSPLPVGPSTTTSRTYIGAPGDKLVVSIDKRDGQSDLYLTNAEGGDERQLTTVGNVDQFVQWFGDDYIVYSAANQLFVVGVNGGKPQKITNFYSGEVHVYGGGYNPNYY